MQILSKILVFILMFLAVQHVALAQENKLPIYTENNPVVMVSSHQPEFTLKLESNPTTGFDWYLQDYNLDLLEPVSQSNESGKDKKIVGAPRYEFWTFRVRSSAFVVPMQTKIRLIYIRPWEKSDVAKSVTFKINTNMAQ